MSSAQWFWLGVFVAFICGAAARPYLDRMIARCRNGLRRSMQHSSDPVEHQTDDYNYQR